MGFVKFTIKVFLVFYPLFAQGQVVSLGLEYHEVIMKGNVVSANDTALYWPGLADDPRPTLVGMVEWSMRDKLSLQLGISGSSFQIMTGIDATVSNSLFPTGTMYRYKYFDLGLPILTKLRIAKNVRIIAGVHPHLLIGRNQENPERLYPHEYRESFEVLGNAIKDNLNRTYVLARYGLEVGLFANRYSLYVVFERNITNLMKNQNLAIPTPTALNYSSIGAGLQYRFRGKLAPDN
ncbi:MAG: hypothetical protein GY816_22460 [Cytophagales bacterium]|nr:hypothetical protein [Cytophagales bacterium]